MSFQGQVTPAALPQDPLGLQLRSVADLGKVLSAGSVINVQIAYDPANPQTLGLFYNGQFFPAVVPENISAGSRLQVTVLDNADAVILKILGAVDPKAEESKSLTQTLYKNYPALMKDLSLLLREDSPKELKSIFAPLKEELLKLGVLPKPPSDQVALETTADTIEDTNQLLATIPAIPSPISPVTSEKSVAAQVDKIIAKLLGKGVVIEEQALEQPDKTYQALINASTNSVLKNVNEAKEALQKIAGPNLTPKELYVLKTIEQEIKAILKEIPPSEGRAPSPKAEAVGAPALQNEALTLKLPAEVERQLTVLFEVLKNLKLPKRLATELPANTLKENFQQFSFDLRNELAEILSRKSPELGREALSKALKNLKEIFGLDRYTPEETKYIQNSMQALSSLESLSQAQETLNQLNPIMDAMGEPILILFPMLTSGLLSKLKLSAEHPKVDPDGEQNGGEKRGEMNRIDFALNLPSIGQVQVNLAHSKVEVYATIVFEREDVAAVAKTELEKLSSRLESLGFKSINLNVKSGETTEITPSWVRELSWNDGIVA